MMTPDKDFGQLVDEHTFIYKPARAGGPAEVMGPAEVCKRWDIERVEQVKDILGLMGDASDNIPGIPGVGEKTAIQLVKQFGSIENLLENTDQLKGKLKEKVELNKEMAIQSKRLATIILDAPVNNNLNDLIAVEPDKEKLRELFTELEFRRLAEQLNLSNVPAAEPGKSKPIVLQSSQTSMFGDDNTVVVPVEEKNEEPELAAEKDLNTIHTTEHKYFLADSEKERKNLLAELLKHESVCFDTETTGLDSSTAELVGLSFSVKKHEGWYVPVPADQNAAKKIVDEFKPFFENEKIEKIAQNLKYDLAILQRYGVELSGKTFDTMIAHFLIQPEMRHNMDVMSETYLSYSPVSIETLIGKKGKEQLNMRDAPIDAVAEYAAEDADITLQLKEDFEPKLKKAGLEKLFHEVEMPLVNVLMDMETEGIRLDTSSLKELSEVLAKILPSQKKKFKTMAGYLT
ncbi:MAG: DNA polymerase I, partial [Saprospiraceae bacterium]